jgi:hypothetical protein
MSVTQDKGIKDAVTAFQGEFTKAVAGLADLQRKALDEATRQQDELVEQWKKHAAQMPFATVATSLVALTAHGFQQAVQVQKDALALAVEQSRKATGLSQEHVDFATRTANSLTTLTQQYVDYATAAQKKALDLAATQNAVALDAAKKQFEAATKGR